jgi:segregation and condensation protein A
MSEATTYPAAQLMFELESFDGPLDLLLYLIKQDEVDICDIPIAEITRQYLSYLEACRELNLEIAGEFLFMASMLIRIKAQMLLPRQGEPEELEDPRAELVNALLEYKKIKQVSLFLEDLEQTQFKRYPRCDYALVEMPSPERELMRVDLTTLMIAFGDLMRRSRYVTSYEVQPEEVTVEIRKERILAILAGKGTADFAELFRDDPRKIVLVVTFIALLELVKAGILRVEQATRFSPIRLYKETADRAMLLEKA